jgi:hypothetical protein
MNIVTISREKLHTEEAIELHLVDQLVRRRTIQAFQRDKAMRNASMQEQEARDMLMELMLQRAVRGAGRAV